MSADLASDIRWYVMLASMVIILRFIYYLNCALPMALFGEREKRCMRLRRTAGLSAAVVISTTGAYLIADYFWLTQLRRTAHACDTYVSDSGEYIATQCLLNARRDYLRLYEGRTGRLIADRTYSCEPSDVKVIVGDGMVFDGCAYSDSTIKLPPSLLDRLRAKLP